MDRAYYADSITSFHATHSDGIVRRLAGRASEDGFAPRDAQLDAWREQIEFLRRAIDGYAGWLFFEYSIPRMGRRIDAVILINHVLFVVEFKVGESRFERAALDQVWDYALDLKNFHETSHHLYVAPILVATAAPDPRVETLAERSDDKLLDPIRANLGTFRGTIERVLRHAKGDVIRPEVWETGRYRPTPTIIEAAVALYSHHAVADITRSDAGAINLTRTSETILGIIREAKREGRKSICFVTGVPGAGKTLVGLNVATKNLNPEDALHSVYLSGNGPLVRILCEALARDEVRRAKEEGGRVRLSEARSRAKAFIQNVHHFRDECLRDDGPPVEHVSIFDEAQRAWTAQKTADFMKRRKGRPGFVQSEPEYLISCLDRHDDWAVVICLVGEGQEIHTGEAGIGEWIASLERSYPDWHIHVSPHFQNSEYGAGQLLNGVTKRGRVHMRPDLHLSTSMRSFRAENVSLLVKQVLDLDVAGARGSLAAAERYPFVLTRDFATAKRWLRRRARGSERYGLVASSQAERLKPHAIAVKAPVDPVHWFLDEKEDVRSSYYLEDAATEFLVQGLELDWACVTWDADLRHDGRKTWDYWSFKGKAWQRIRSPDRQRYLRNAYRVLLTRARQGVVIVVPEGDDEDPTRDPRFYDPTFNYLCSIGFEVI